MKVDLADKLIDTALELAEVAHSVGIPFLLEHPEDLGATANGIPASIWQLEKVRRLADATKAITGAFYQCQACLPGSKLAKPDYPKPTRFLGTMYGLDKMVFVGWPQIDDLGKYSGPLPSWCGHVHKRKLTATPRTGENGGHFATTGTAAYPPAMCEWMAKSIFASAFKNKFSSASTPSGGGPFREA